MLEHALILALLVISGVGAYVLVAAGADRVFKVTSHIVGPAGDSERSPAPRTASVHSPSVVRGASADPSDPAPGVTARVVIVVAWVVVWTAITCLGLVLWRLIRVFACLKDSRTDAVLPPTPPELLDQVLGKRQQIRRLLSLGLENSLPTEALVQHLMSTDVVIIAPGASFAEAAAIMAERRIRHLLVCGENHRLVGIISDRDIRVRMGETAADIMTRDLITVSPQTPIAPTITLMISKSISCLPVLSQEGELRGILTTTDLMLALQCALQVFVRISSGLCLPASSPRPPDCQITEQSPTCLTEVVESEVGSTTPPVGSHP